MVSKNEYLRTLKLLNSSSAESIDDSGKDPRSLNSTVEASLSPAQFYDNMLYLVEKMKLPPHKQEAFKMSKPKPLDTVSCSN